MRMDDLRKELREMRRLEQEMRRVEVELRRSQRKLKQDLLAGATIEPGVYYAELRLLPGRDPASKDPDGYELVVS